MLAADRRRSAQVVRGVGHRLATRPSGAPPRPALIHILVTMSRLSFERFDTHSPPAPRGRFWEILLIAAVGAICAVIITWPRG